MNIVIWTCAVLLFISALLVIVRVCKGPTVLDRTGALDVITSIMMGALALLAAVTRRADLLAVFVVVAVIGFLGSVAVARAARPKHSDDVKASENDVVVEDADEHDDMDEDTDIDEGAESDEVTDMAETEDSDD